MTSASNMEVVDPAVYPGWDELVASHPAATFFHTAGWARVLSETYGYHAAYFIARDRERLATLIPFMEIQSWITGKRGVSLPFTDECAPILQDGMCGGSALSHVMEVAGGRGWKTVEFRGRVRELSDPPSAEEYLSHELDLTETEEALCSRFRPNVQRNIRKAERAGIEVSIDGTSLGVREFYRMNCLTRRDHGLPPQPLLFFENLRKHVLEKDLGTLLLARYRGKAIAGAVFLHFGRMAIYKYGASDRRHQDLRANNLVFREGIRILCARGFQSLSFGRTDLAHEGLRQFKLSWGPKETRLQYYRFDVRSKTWLTGRQTRFPPWEGVISRMPIPVLRFVGEIAYRHIG
jgi:hypothetical protein